MWTSPERRAHEFGLYEAKQREVAELRSELLKCQGTEAHSVNAADALACDCSAIVLSLLYLADTSQ